MSRQALLRGAAPLPRNICRQNGQQRCMRINKPLWHGQRPCDDIHQCYRRHQASCKHDTTSDISSVGIGRKHPAHLQALLGGLHALGYA